MSSSDEILSLSNEIEGIQERGQSTPPEEAQQAIGSEENLDKAYGLQLQNVASQKRRVCTPLTQILTFLIHYLV